MKITSSSPNVPGTVPPTLDLQPQKLGGVRRKLAPVHGPHEPVQQKLGGERGRLAPAHGRHGGVRRKLGGEFLRHDPERPMHDPEFLPHGVERERLEPVRGRHAGAFPAADLSAAAREVLTTPLLPGLAIPLADIF